MTLGGLWDASAAGTTVRKPPRKEKMAGVTWQGYGTRRPPARRFPKPPQKEKKAGVTLAGLRDASAAGTTVHHHELTQEKTCTIPRDTTSARRGELFV